MSTNTVDNKRKVTTSRLTEMKARGEKIAMLTAYDFSMAQLIDATPVWMLSWSATRPRTLWPAI